MAIKKLNSQKILEYKISLHKTLKWFISKKKTLQISYMIDLRKFVFVKCIF